MWTRLFSCIMALALASCSIRDTEPPASPVANAVVELKLRVSPEPEIKKYKVTVSWPAEDWPGDRTLQRSVRFVNDQPDWKDIFSEKADQPIGTFEEVLEEPGLVGYRLVDINGYKTPINLSVNSTMIPTDLVIEGERQLGMKDFNFGRIVFRDKAVAIVIPYRIADNRYAVPSISANYIYSDGEATIRTPNAAEYLHLLKTETRAPMVRPMIMFKTLHLRGKLKLQGIFIPPLEKEEVDSRNNKLEPNDFNTVPVLLANIVDPGSEVPTFEFIGVPVRKPGVDFSQMGSLLLHAGKTKLWVGNKEVPAHSFGFYEDIAQVKKYYVLSPTGSLAVLDHSGTPTVFSHLWLFKESDFGEEQLKLENAPAEDPRYVPDFTAKRVAPPDNIPNFKHVLDLFERIDELNKKFQIWELSFFLDVVAGYPFDPESMKQCFDSLARLEPDTLRIYYSRRILSIMVVSANFDEKFGRAAFDAYNHGAILYTDPGKGCERGLRDLKQTLLAH